MEIVFFTVIIFTCVLAFIFFIRMGKYTNRRRIINYTIPEGWIEIIQKTLIDYEGMSSDEKQRIHEIVQVIIAEKKFESTNTQFEVKNIHRVTLAAYAARISRFSIDPYLEKSSIITIGNKDSYFNWTDKGPESATWNNPKAYETLGFEKFSSNFNGVYAAWACFYPYHPAKFQHVLEDLTFDKSLFPLFTEVFFSGPELLKEKYPSVYEYLKKEFNSK